MISKDLFKETTVLNKYGGASNYLAVNKFGMGLDNKEFKIYIPL